MQTSGISSTEVFLFLLFAAVIFALVAKRVRLPYPIVLVVAGLALSLIPGVPAVEMDPDFILQVILPLLLFYAAWHTSWVTLMHNAWSIFMLAVGLVIFTTFGVAFAAPLFLAGFDWRTGFLLGAVIAPTDAVAATSIARTLGLPKNLVDIIEGESLVNDATGLLAFEIGVGLILADRVPTVGESALRLLFMTVAGIAIGLGIGYLVVRLERYVDDPAIVIAITILIPYGAYFSAERAGASGILAVVACGLFHSYRSSEYRSARVRLEAESAWNALDFILNGLVFVLIGLQLKPILRGLTGISAGQLVLDVLIFSVIVIALRMLWVFPAMPLGAVIARLAGRREECPSWRGIFVIGWSSMRGVIALAIAMSIPHMTSDRVPFPQRGMIIFLAFGGIFLSLVMKGITLPPIIRALGLSGASEPMAAETEARKLVVEAALKQLQSLRAAGGLHDEQYDDLKRHLSARIATLKDDDLDEHGTAAEHTLRYLEISRELLQVERETAIRLRNDRRVGDDVLRDILRDLDLEESRVNLQQSRIERAKS